MNNPRFIVATLIVLAMPVVGRAQSISSTGRPPLSESAVEYRQSLPEARPPLRGFRAPILDHAAIPWPFMEPQTDATEPVHRAAELVGTRLAREGLLKTAANVIETIGPAQFLVGSADSIEALKRAGLPADLLAYFEVEGSPPLTDLRSRASAAIAAIARRVASKPASSELNEWLGRMPFRFIQIETTFRAATESGEGDFGVVRLQLTRPDYWAGINDGCSVDITRQLIEKIPDTDLLVNIEQRFVEPFSMLAGAWPLRRPTQLYIVPSQLPVAQWARDNGIAGSIIADQRTGRLAHATLAPRYASRSENGSTFVPGESFVMDDLAAAGQVVFQSPLLFQGGDLIVVFDAPRRQRVLLIGESQVWVNTTLGLTPEQVLTAFKIELGVDRCEVLPAASCHIDYQVTFRAEKSGVTAFVNDPVAASKIIVELGTRALAKGGIFGNDILTTALDHLSHDRAWDYADLIGPILGGRSPASGQYSESLTAAFATTPTDSAVGNFQIYLSALDLWLSMAVDQIPSDSVDPQTRSYLLARRRLVDDGRRLRQQIAALGWKTVSIPSLGDSSRGINYLNGLHDRTRYLMPAIGGLFTPLDNAAADAFRHSVTPDVEIVPIVCAESQRRAGALRCSAAYYPRLVRADN
jgi:hypothetical protein